MPWKLIQPVRFHQRCGKTNRKFGERYDVDAMMLEIIQ